MTATAVAPSARGPAFRGPRAGADPGEPRTPHVDVEGFSGPLDLLLATARADRLELARISFADLLDQLADALNRPDTLTEKASWVVIGAAIVELRSRLLLPQDSPEQQAADAETRNLRDRLAELQVVQAIAAWLDARPQVGRDVFVRGQPEWLGVTSESAAEVDTIEFLWASVALFDDDEVDTETAYRPRPPDLHSVPDARARILRLLAEAPSGLSLVQLLPVAAPSPGGEPESRIKRRSAWTSTFVAGLELAKQGDLALDQAGVCEPVMMRLQAHHPDETTHADPRVTSDQGGAAP